MTKYFTKEGDDFKEVETELFTQERVDNVVKERAERIARQQFGDYDELKEKAGKLDEATTKITDLEKQVGEAKLGIDKVKIMHEFKLPDTMDEFVTGATADEMRAKAEKLSKGVKPEALDLDKKPKPKDTKEGDSKAMAGKLFGRKSD